jgi:hypothetical protein
VLQLKTAYRNGTTHSVMSPLEFMQRPAALVPRPRLTTKSIQVAGSRICLALICPNRVLSRPYGDSDKPPGLAVRQRLAVLVWRNQAASSATPAMIKVNVPGSGTGANTVNLIDPN